MKRFMVSVIMTIAVVAMIPGAAFAHVVVTPKQAGVGERTLFTMSVPNEEKVAVTGLRLVVPLGLEEVQPNVMGGWSISTETNSAGDVTSITWTGNIPVGQRADLVFKAQTPASATELDWKAYQTYADGTVVNWDQKPVASTTGDDSSTSAPYSVTDVVSGTAGGISPSLPILSIILSVFAVAVSILSLLIRKRK